MIPPFPASLQAFVELFNREAFWESHEVLESPWREGRSEFYKGLILFASAFVHVQRGNPRGIAAQLRKTVRHLEAYRPSYLGVNVDTILAHTVRCRAVVEECRTGSAVDWEALVPAMQLTLEPELVRGDEPELAS